jgi:hypothetical protein
MTVQTITHEAGWGYIEPDRRRRPFAYLMPVGKPGEGLLVECPQWWNALAVCMTLAGNSETCHMVGGPDYE